MEDKEWDELKLIQEKIHEGLEKGYPPLGTGGLNKPTGVKKLVSDILDIPRTTVDRKIEKIGGKKNRFFFFWKIIEKKVYSSTYT